MAVPELSSRYPRARSYLKSLPQGFDSFPDCRARGEVFDDVRMHFPELGRDPMLPPVIAGFFKGEYANRWMPEVVGQVVNLMIRDAALPTDDALLKWSYETSSRLFRDSPFRVLMKLVSPTLLVMGAAQRWSALHAGSTLESGKVERTEDGSATSGLLRFPAGLFPELFLRALAPAFQAAVENARARNVAVNLRRFSSTDAEYRITWR
jgi:hypothetical protein